MGRASWNKAAADRSANIMEGKYPNTRTLTIILAANHANPNPNITEGVRRSNASRQRISSREGMYRAIDSLPA